jgi:hypothetical protein
MALTSYRLYVNPVDRRFENRLPGLDQFAVQVSVCSSPRVLRQRYAGYHFVYFLSENKLAVASSFTSVWLN